MNKFNNLVKYINNESNFVYSPVGLNDLVYQLLCLSCYDNYTELQTLNPNKIWNGDFFEKHDLFFVDKVYKDMVTINNYDVFDKYNLNSVEDIQRKIAEKTHNLITGFPSVRDISDADFIAANTNYLKLRWLREFNLKRNEHKEFCFKNDEKEYYPEYISNNGYLNYYESDKIDILEMPTENSDCSFYAFKPKSINISDILDDFNLYYSLINAIGSNYATDVFVEIPKFDITSEFSFKDVFSSNLFVRSIFEYSKNWNFINWDKLFDEAVIKVSSMLQKARIIVNEKEVEAASCSAAFMSISGCMMGSRTPKIKVFKFDEPFVFTCVDNKNKKMPLYVGAYYGE